MKRYYSKNGSQLGPVEQGGILSKLASGEISPSDMVIIIWLLFVIFAAASGGIQA